MMKMNGKNNPTVEQLFNLQKQNQLVLLNKKAYGATELSNLPVDNVTLSSYHLLHLVSELGEILDADKRWKNFRNDKYDKDAKAEEIADCFIVLLNIAMYSGIDGDDLSKAILDKIEKVSARVSGL